MQLYIKNYICFFFLLIYGCANIVAPTGGEKDNAPPKLVFSKPENGAVNFKNQDIILEFDEYVQIKNKHLIRITPSCNESIDLIQRGKQIKLILNCELDQNTTYIINFGQSIIDLNEGNVLQNFNYTFSTGPIIDSLIITGRVIELYSNKVVPNSLVGLYQSLDSINPYYYGFSEDNGNFIINHIKSGDYILCAIKDDNKNFQHDPGELISWPKNISNFNETIDLKLFNEEPTSKILHVKNNSCNSILFEHFSPKDSITVLNTEGFWNRDEKSSSFWFNSVEKYIQYQFNNKIDSIEIYNVDSIDLTLDSSVQLDGLNKYVLIKCNQPIKKIHKNKLQWISNNEPVRAILLNDFIIQILVDSSINKGQLIINANAIESVFHNGNDSISFAFDFNQENYGSININSLNNNGRNIIELFNAESVIRKEVLTDSISLSFIPPGTYSIRVFQDINGDGVWTPGNINSVKKPEPIQIYPNNINIKSNWEVDIEIDLKSNL